MSKKLIAGTGVVASFAIALAPLATFATLGNEADQHTDRHTVTVTPSCTFGTNTTDPDTLGVDHNAEATGKATWLTTNDGNNDTTDDNAVVPSDGTGADLAATTYSNSYTNKSLHIAEFTTTAGKAYTGFATTTLTIICNSDTGYTLKANAANLNISGYDGSSVTQNIPIASTATAASSGYNFGVALPASGYSGTAQVDSNNASVTATGLKRIGFNTGVSREEGDPFTITYNLGVAASQKAGTYTGDVVFTLFQGQD